MTDAEAAAPTTGPDLAERRRRRHRAPRGQGGALRTEILDAAEQMLLGGAGEQALSMRSLADAVGVTPPSIYRHFADKDQLLLQVCERRFLEMDAELERAGATSPDPVHALRHRAEAYIRFGIEHPEHYRTLFIKPGAHADRPPSAAGMGAFAHLVDAVRRCVESGAFRDDDPRVMALALWSGLHGLTALLIAMPDFPWPPVDELVSTVLDVHVRGLAAGGAGGPDTAGPDTARPDTAR